MRCWRTWAGPLRRKKQSQEEPGRARINESTWLLLTRPGSKGKENWEISGGTQRSNRASKARVPIVKVRSLCRTQHASSRSSRNTRLVRNAVCKPCKQAMVQRSDTRSNGGLRSGSCVLSKCQQQATVDHGFDTCKCNICVWSTPIKNGRSRTAINAGLREELHITQVEMDLISNQA